MDYAADVSVCMNSIEGWEFKTKLTLDKVGKCFPLALYMEQTAAYGQNANKLFLLACKKAPGPVRETLHPGAFRPRKTTDGGVTDARRKSPMWQVSAQLNSGRFKIVILTGVDDQEDYQ